MLQFRIVLFMTIFILIPICSNAGSVSQAGALFLRIPVGARASGMGDAYTAVAEDASATWWNPAGLAFINRTETGNNTAIGYHNTTQTKILGILAYFIISMNSGLWAQISFT